MVTAGADIDGALEQPRRIEALVGRGQGPGRHREGEQTEGAGEHAGRCAHADEYR